MVSREHKSYLFYIHTHFIFHTHNAHAWGGGGGGGEHISFVHTVQLHVSEYILSLSLHRRVLLAKRYALLRRVETRSARRSRRVLRSIRTTNVSRRELRETMRELL
jgi:hypothetical protein